MCETSCSEIREFLHLFSPSCLQPFIDWSETEWSESITERSVKLNPIEWSEPHSLLSGSRVDGYLDGYCSLEFTNGDRVECRFEKGTPMGAAVIGSRRMKMDKLCGTFVNGKLEGAFKLVTVDTSVSEGFVKRDVLHGPLRRMEMRRFREFRRQTTFIGTFKQGRQWGPSWNYTEGGGHVFLFESESETDGKRSLKGAFVYPDLKTAYVGYFSPDLSMLEASPATIVSTEKQESHVLIPKFVVTNLDVVVGRSISTQCSVGPHPLVSDPYESVVVRVGVSTIPQGGEGLFATTKLDKGVVVAFYNGIRIPFKLGGPKEEWATSAYKIFVNADFKSGERMDIPQNLISLHNYRATLAHKVNHSFCANCTPWFFDHPRHGMIPCLKTCEPVMENEELTMDYDYDPFNCPDWFKLVLDKFILDNESSLNEVLPKKYWTYAQQVHDIDVCPHLIMVPHWARRG